MCTGAHTLHRCKHTKTTLAVSHLCERSWCWPAGSLRWGRRYRWCRSQSPCGSSYRRRAPRRRRWPGTWSPLWQFQHTALHHLYWGPLGWGGVGLEKREKNDLLRSSYQSCYGFLFNIHQVLWGHYQWTALMVQDRDDINSYLLGNKCVGDVFLSSNVRYL